MVGQKDNIAGNILFYEYLSAQRNPVFLHRNLTQVLKIHNNLKNGNTSHPTTPNHDFRQFWNVPTSWDALDEMVEHEKARGTFQLDVRGIRSLNGNYERPAKKKSYLRLEIEVHVTVFDRNNPACLKKISDTNATITLSTSQDRTSTIKTPSITIRPEDLANGSMSGMNNAQSWAMLLSISFKDSYDASCFYSFLGCDESLQDKASTRLTSEKVDIMDWLTSDKILPLKTCEQSSSRKNLNVGLEVAMGWLVPKDKSILASHNRQLRANTQLTHLPTPPLEHADGPKFVVSYAYADDITLTRHSLECHFDGRKFEKINDLHMHLRTCHDKFEYVPEKEKEEAGIQYWHFKCEVAEYKPDARASDRVADPREVLVVAPSEPFDQDRFLEGNDEFQRSARLEKKTKQIPSSLAPHLSVNKSPLDVQARPLAVKKKYQVPAAPPNVTFFRSLSKRPLQQGEYIDESDDEIEEDWVRRTKKYYLATLPGAPEAAKRFLKGFDLHMQYERLPGQLYVGDAIIRFSRDKASWLWQEQLVEEFQKKMYELLEDHIISDEVYNASLEMVMDAKEENIEEENFSTTLAQLGVQHARKTNLRIANTLNDESESPMATLGKGTARITGTGNITPQNTDSDGDIDMFYSHCDTEPVSNLIPPAPVYDQCLCGQDALASAMSIPIIMCKNTSCIRQTFHLECIKKYWTLDEPLTSANRNWTCHDCQNETTQA